MSNFIVQALRGEHITIFGKGTQTRSFCYVDDLIEGIVRMMATRRGFTGPVNLGNPQELSILDLAERVIRLTRSQSRVRFKPLPEDDPKQRRPDVRLAVKQLKWKPRVAIDDGLKETIRYFRRVLKH